MKNKSLNKGKPNSKVAKKGQNKQKSPIIKAKHVLNTLIPKDLKGSPKKLIGNPKATNGSPEKSPIIQGKKKGKKNKTPVSNDSDSDEESAKKRAIGAFGGTSSLGDVTLKKKGKQKPSLKGDSKGKRNEVTSDNSSPLAKKQKTGPKKMLKALDKRAEVLNNQNTQNKKRKYGLVKSIIKLSAEKNTEQLQLLLPLIDSTIKNLESDNDSITKKRKLRMLSSYKKKIETGTFGPIQPHVKKVRKGKPEVPKEMLNMTQEDSDEESEDAEGETVAEKLEKAVEKDKMDESDNEGDDNDNQQGEEEESDDADEEEIEVSKPAPQKKPGTSPQQKPKSAKKSRFVLFVGNLSYDVKEDDIKKHFEKVGSIVSVRLGKHKDTNKSKGFCHIEFNNEEAYEKGLSMHHTILSSRRINVMYSQGTSEKAKEDKKKKNFKVKDMKLKGMKDKGLLAGSTKQSQKRSVRRKKAKTTTE